MYFIVFACSLLVLILAANYLVRSTEKLSSSLKISPLVVGATGVAIGTSLPELSVTVSSIAQGASSLGIGNIIGSNVSNILLILGVNILLFPIRVGTTKTQRNNLISLVFTFLFITAFFIPLVYKKTLFLILLAGYLVFLITELVWGEIGGKKEDRKNLAKLQKSHENPLSSLIKIIVAIFILLASSKFTVSSALEIASFFKLKSEVVGLTLLAIGTSLPELVSCLASGLKNDCKLIMGEVQGSNIFNLGVLGSTILYSSKDLSQKENILPLLYLALSTLLLTALTKRYEGEIIPRLYGLLFLGIYSSYLLVVFI
jgi:cation:H+ antiporter